MKTCILFMTQASVTFDHFYRTKIIKCLLKASSGCTTCVELANLRNVAFCENLRGCSAQERRIATVRTFTKHQVCMGCPYFLGLNMSCLFSTSRKLRCRIRRCVFTKIRHYINYFHKIRISANQTTCNINHRPASLHYLVYRHNSCTDVLIHIFSVQLDICETNHMDWDCTET